MTKNEIDEMIANNPVKVTIKDEEVINALFKDLIDNITDNDILHIKKDLWEIVDTKGNVKKSYEWVDLTYQKQVLGHMKHYLDNDQLKGDKIYLASIK